MPTKGKLRRIISKAIYHKKIRLYREKIRESEKAEDFASGSAQNFCVTVCACLAERSDATCHRQAHAMVTDYIF